MEKDIIALQVTGMGKTLALDFIKDLGPPISEWCIKPDTLIRKTLHGLGLVRKGCPEEDYVYCLENIVRSASRQNFSMYALDKLLWLANSGKFHRHPKIGRVWPKNKSGEVRTRLLKKIKAGWNGSA